MYIIGNHSYTEDPNRKLGSGSEGAVYPFPDNPAQCVKLFHEAEPDDINAQSLALYRAKKIAAICHLNLSMPKQFILPLEAAYDNRHRVKGFLMHRVPPGHVKILELLKPWRTANGIGLKEIVALFATLLGVDLEEIARHKLAIGDVNTGCVMIDKTLNHSWVDTDSWSYPGYSCLATTELYAHPELYPNLEKGQTFVSPTIQHDRFALIVMFVQIALQGAHPFRMGVHQKYSSLRERARHGVTIFDSGVTYPKALPSPEILSDDLLERIIRILKHKENGKDFAADLIKFADALATCKQCGINHDAARSHCPKCHEKTVIDMSKLMKLLIKTLYTAKGTILHVQVIDKAVRIVCNLQGAISIVHIDSSSKENIISTSLVATKGAKYRFFGKCLVITREPYAQAPVPLELYIIDGISVRRLSDTSTGGLENDQALVDCSGHFLYRTAGNTLMCCTLFGRDTLMEERVAQVHQTQTWFTVDHSNGADREALFGYDRALRDIQWFVIRGNADGNKFSYQEVSLPAMRQGEKQSDFAVYFSKESVLLVRSTALQGREYIRYSIIMLDGKVLKDELLSESDQGFEYWSNLQGKLYQGDSILHVTDKGIVKQIFANNAYQHLDETDGVVAITDQLFRWNNQVGVARKEKILTICKKTVSV